MGKLEKQEVEQALKVGLVMRPLESTEMTVGYVLRDYTGQDLAVTIPADDAFLIMVYLTDVEHSDIWPNRPPTSLRMYPRGSICLINHIALALNGYVAHRYGRSRRTH